MERLLEFKRSSNALPAQSPQAATAQRQLFRTLEKYLDAGHGSCPLSLSAAAHVVVEELESLSDWRITVPHFTIMPNHWHALIVPPDATVPSLSAILKRVKGRTAKRIRKFIPGSGSFWQGEWFDRWIRDGSELERVITYIQNNPVKARLTPIWQQHPFTR